MPTNLIDAIAERVAQAMLAGGSASIEMNRPTSDGPVQRGYSQEESDYTDQGEEEHCADCVHFASMVMGGPQPGDRGACRIVEGEIAPGGWCRFFAPAEGEYEEEEGAEEPASEEEQEAASEGEPEEREVLK